MAFCTLCINWRTFLVNCHHSWPLFWRHNCQIENIDVQFISNWCALLFLSLQWWWWVQMQWVDSTADMQWEKENKMSMPSLDLHLQASCGKLKSNGLIFMASFFSTTLLWHCEIEEKNPHMKWCKWSFRWGSNYSFFCSVLLQFKNGCETSMAWFFIAESEHYFQLTSVKLPWTPRKGKLLWDSCFYCFLFSHFGGYSIAWAKENLFQSEIHGVQKSG